MVDGQYGWTRLPAVDSFTYAPKFADFTTGDGYPPPCLQLKGTTITRSIIPVNGSSTIKSWVLSGMVNVPVISSNNMTQSLTIYDNNATPKNIVQMGYWRYINTPDGTHATLSVKCNSTVIDTEVFNDHYQTNWPKYCDKWIPFSMTATADGIYCSFGIMPAIKIAPGTGSDWKNPASVSLTATEVCFWDNLRFGDY
jgi:hypothetical protein